MTGRVKIRTMTRVAGTKSGSHSKIGCSAKPTPKDRTEAKPWDDYYKVANFETEQYALVEAAAHSLLADRRHRHTKNFDCTHEEAVAAVQKALEMVANGWRPPVKMTEEELLEELERRMK